jgi:hypothetical protein
MAEIYGAELVTDIFGYWPSFHDAEVVRMTPGAQQRVRVGVVFEGVHGVSASFRCREVMVVGVQPWDVETGAPPA